jgi:hypothetical protein
MSAILRFVVWIEDKLFGDLAEPTAAKPFVERRRQRLRCRKCASEDVWRVRAGFNWYAELMSLRGLKPFQCRCCNYRFYFRARRHTDQ